MAEIVWKLDDIALKRQLLKLSKSKLIKLCKKKKVKVSSNATKQDLVNALMTQNKSPVITKKKKTKKKATSIKKNNNQNKTISKDSNKQTNNISPSNKTHKSISIQPKINIDDLHANNMTMSNTKTRELIVSAYCRDLIKLLTKELTDDNVDAIQNAINILKMIESYCNPESNAYYEGYTKRHEPYQVFGRTVNILIDGYNREMRKKFHLPNIGKDLMNLILLYYEIIQDKTAPVIIQIGSQFIKSGFAGDDAPRSVFHGCIGKPRAWRARPYEPQYAPFIGDDAISKRGILELCYPIKFGMIKNWDDWEKLMHHTFYNELRVCPEEHDVLMTEAPLTPKNDREKICEIMFETFYVRKYFTIIDAVLACYASGRTTGIIWTGGHEVCHIVPVYEGYCLPHAISRCDIGGKDCTNYLGKLLCERGYSFTTIAEKEIVNDIKEKLCYVANDLDSEIALFESSNDMETDFELPDGSVIQIGSERVRACEMIFNPSLVGFSMEGMHKLLFNSIMKCDRDIQRDWYENIVLTGGHTMFEGLSERIKKEIGMLVSDGMKINVIASEERKYSQWIGGSILTSLSTFDEMWITKYEYDEVGPSIVNRKCN